MERYNSTDLTLFLTMNTSDHHALFFCFPHPKARYERLHRTKIALHEEERCREVNCNAARDQRNHAVSVEKGKDDACVQAKMPAAAAPLASRGVDISACNENGLVELGAANTQTQDGNHMNAMHPGMTVQDSVAERCIPETIPPTPLSAFNMSEPQMDVITKRRESDVSRDMNNQGLEEHGGRILGLSPFSPLFHSLDDAIRVRGIHGQSDPTSVGKYSRYTPLGCVSAYEKVSATKKRTPDSDHVIGSSSKEKRRAVALDSSPCPRNRWTPSREPAFRRPHSTRRSKGTPQASHSMQTIEMASDQSILGLNIRFPQPILAAAGSSNGRYVVVLMGSHADYEPEEILVLELGCEICVDSIDAKAGSNERRHDTNKYDPSKTIVKVASSILVQRSVFATGLALSSSSFAVIADEDLKIPVVILSAALSPHEAPTNVTRPCLSVILCHKEQKTTGIKDSTSSILSVEHEYPLFAVAPRKGRTILASGIGAEISTLGFGRGWESYTWGRPFRGDVTKETKTHDIDLSAASVTQESVDVHTLTLIEDAWKAPILVGILSTGGVALWDLDKRELVAVIEHSAWDFSAVYPVSTSRIEKQPRSRGRDTGESKTGYGSGLEPSAPKMLDVESTFCVLARVHQRHRLSYGGWDTGLAVVVCNTNHQKSQEPTMSEPLPFSRPTLAASAGDMTVVGCANGEIWISNFNDGISYGPIALCQEEKTPNKSLISAIVLGGAGCLNQCCSDNMLDIRSCNEDVSFAGKGKAQSIQSKRVVITSLDGDCWILDVSHLHSLVS